MPPAAPTATTCGAACAASGLLSFGFLAGQLFVWKQLHDAGYFVSSSAATAFFYLLTAVHGLHVLGGLVAWARASARAWRGSDPARIRLGVELCATYWHYLLAVWVVLYALLVSEGRRAGDLLVGAVVSRMPRSRSRTS